MPQNNIMEGSAQKHKDMFHETMNTHIMHIQAHIQDMEGCNTICPEIQVKWVRNFNCH